jgi:hypothetical protein
MFSVCDVKNGFWHVELELQLSHNILSSQGMLKVAAHANGNQSSQAMEGLPGVKIIADDILIVGEGDNDEAATVDLNLRVEITFGMGGTKYIYARLSTCAAGLGSVLGLLILLADKGSALHWPPANIRGIERGPRKSDSHQTDA